MNHRIRSVLASTAAPLLSAVLASTLAAQIPTPLDAPPWWGVQDEETMSLYWDFSGATPFVPQQVATASWYNPQQTVFATTGPLQVIPALAGRTDVLGILGNGSPQTASIDLTADNDPHVNWVKIFEVQFDALEGTVGEITASLEEQLAAYDRSSVTWESVPVGGGWETVTIMGELWPQPDDEDVVIELFTDLNNDVAIDDLFVSSRCVKVEDADADAEALGEVDDSTFGQTGINLTAATGGRTCVAAALTENPATFQRSYWVSALAPGTGLPHRLIRFNASGQPISSTNLPDTPAAAPFGASDLTVRTIQTSPTAPHTQVVYAIVDRRGSPGGSVEIRAIDALSGALLTPLFVTAALPAAGGPEPLSIAFNRDGDLGAGTFLITDQGGLGYEVALTTGAVLRTFQSLPQRAQGAGYDHTFGRYYFFSSQPEATPRGTLRVNGSEYSAYDHRPTGTRFWGNLQVPNAGGPPGGIARGFEVYRLLNPNNRGGMHMLAVVQTGQGSVLYELHGPWRFGRSLRGRTTMRGQPFEGTSNFELRLEGMAPNTAPFAALYVGFSNVASGPTLLPVNLATFGFTESQLLVSPDMRSNIVPQGANGQFRFVMPTLPPGFSNVPLFFQWLVFDPSATNGIAMSSGGKTLIY